MLLGFFKKQGHIIFGYSLGSGLASNVEKYCLKISMFLIPCTDPEILMFKW